MSKFAPVKITVPFFAVAFAALLITISGCVKKRSEMATVLYKQTHQQVYKELTDEDYAPVFKEVFNQLRPQLKHADLISAFYKSHNYQPVFVLGHLFNYDLDTAVNYFQRAADHGLTPAMFQADKLQSLLSNFHDKTRIKTPREAYRDMAELEIRAANSLINYSNDLQYGVINPKAIYQRYFLATLRPDSSAMLAVFKADDLQNYLAAIQPKDPQYKLLQSTLKMGLRGPGMSQEETKRLLIVNLERLRWRNKPTENRYVIVNIPDFTLDVVDSGRSVLHMKVCVGQGRNMDYANTLDSYNDTCKEDKPNEHETPLLSSAIYGVEVNPEWNIPQSIANKEIIVQAAKDKFYLANNNIDVYQDGRKIDDSEDIDWSNITKDNLPYDFKQEPGADNSLGLIKFMFKNRSNVYLHDTPVKSAFYRKMRAVSHGCVRLGDPKGLAQNLFGQGDQFQTISNDMGKDDPDPEMIYLPKKVPVYITYITCWADENGNVQMRKDVYGLDIVLYDHLANVINSMSAN
jgi:murein L,D-transpeptidase YcbB/YkuD